MASTLPSILLRGFNQKGARRTVEKYWSMPFIKPLVYDYVLIWERKHDMSTAMRRWLQNSVLFWITGA